MTDFEAEIAELERYYTGTERDIKDAAFAYPYAGILLSWTCKDKALPIIRRLHANARALEKERDELEAARVRLVDNNFGLTQELQLAQSELTSLKQDLDRLEKERDEANFALLQVLPEPFDPAPSSPALNRVHARVGAAWQAAAALRKQLEGK